MQVEDRLSTMDEKQAHHIAARIRDAREYLGLSQEFVSERIGVSRPAYSAMETAKRKISSVELNNLAKLLKKSLEYFFADEDILTEPESTPAHALYRTSKSLSIEDQQQVLKFAEFLKAAGRASNSETSSRQ